MARIKLQRRESAPKNESIGAVTRNSGDRNGWLRVDGSDIEVNFN
jgi:hypothetical protein